MAKKPTLTEQEKEDRKPYPGSERFGDWTMSNIIPMEPGDILVNDDPEGDPHKFANHGGKNPPPTKKK